MRGLLRSRRSQRGAALLIFAALLVLGIAWYAVDTLGKSATRLDAQRELKTGVALRAAKQALLGYTAQYAARSCIGVTPPCAFEVPGRLPCPESTSAIGTAEEGEASSNCTLPKVGRLPWRTLGIEPLRDGDGEPLWYVLSAGFRDPPINFGTTGQLTLDGTANAAVALIIAPGKALNSLGESDTPPSGCSAVNQQSGRYANPLDPAKFLECGNASSSYVTAGSLPWSNDRVIAITATELMDAIAGPIADRLQREVAPRMEYWRSTISNSYWGVRFLPHASTFTDPATDDLCGDTVSGVGVTEGLPPTARSGATCTPWGLPASATKISGPGNLSFQACQPLSTGAWRCVLSKTGGHMSVRISVTAPNVTGSFRAPISVTNVSPSPGLSASNVTHSLNTTTGALTMTVDIAFPTSPNPMNNQIVLIDPLPESSGMASDPEIKWFIENGWDRYVYYAISPAARANPGATCSAPGASECLEVVGLPNTSGDYWNKRLVLALVGQPTGGQIRSCGTYSDPDNPTVQDCDNVKQYLEAENAQYGTGPRVFRANLRIANPSAPTLPLPPFNDRVATCPLQYATDGGAVVICN